MKMRLIIRDDDLSYFAEPEVLDNIYKNIWKTCPVSFATVPFIYSGQNETPIKFRHTKKLYPIGKNKELVEFLKKKIKEGKATIVQHGYSHKNYGKLFECERKDFKKLYEEIKKGKNHLESTFGIKITCFVPPHDRMSKEAVRAVVKAGFKTICRGYSPLPREVDVGSIQYMKAYSKLMRFWLKYKTKYRYPQVLNFGTHKELYSYRIDSRFMRETSQKIAFARKNKGVLCVTGHYRNISHARKEILEHLVKLKDITCTHLNKIK